MTINKKNNKKNPPKTQTYFYIMQLSVILDHFSFFSTFYKYFIFIDKLKLYSQGVFFKKYNCCSTGSLSAYQLNGPFFLLNDSWFPSAVKPDVSVNFCLPDWQSAKKLHRQQSSYISSSYLVCDQVEKISQHLRELCCYSAAWHTFI